MTTQDTSAAPEKEPASKASSIRVKVIALLFAAGFLALALWAVTARLHHPAQQTTTYPVEDPALSDLRRTLEDNEAALAVLRQKQVETTEWLQKMQQATTSTTPSPDLSARYAALSAFDDQLDELPIPVNLTSSKEIAPAMPVSTHSAWQRLGDISKQVWMQLVTIHHAGDDIPILTLTPAIKQLIVLRLHSEIDTAKWALLHNEPDIYKTTLEETRHTLQRYFPQKVSQAALDRLAQLDAAPAH